MDYFNAKGGNAFEQIVANTSGSAAMFEAVDPSLLSPGSISVYVEQLAKRDVFQTNTFADPKAIISEDANDKISIAIGSGDPIEFSLNKSYEDLAKEINATTGLNANVEKTGDNDYRIIIKSTDSGEANALTITDNSAFALGLEDTANNKVQSAQNMRATIDGVAYNVSSNTITVQGGLNITAVEENSTSTINIEKDNTAIAPALENLVSAYNDLLEIIDAELYSTDTPMQDLSNLRMILSNVKNTLLGGYGADGELRVFNYGFELDKTGKMSIDNQKLADAVLNNIDDLKSLFIGSPENKGLGTTLKELIDDMRFSDGLLSLYGDGMTKRRETLETEQTKAVEQLDAKYLQLAQQFAAYTAIITQMESSFGGLKNDD